MNIQRLLMYICLFHLGFLIIKNKIQRLLRVGWQTYFLEEDKIAGYQYRRLHDILWYESDNGPGYQYRWLYDILWHFTLL